LPISRHCEKRSDEAIHASQRRDGLLRFARNDGTNDSVGSDHALEAKPRRVAG
jgi:hypothetical protein